MSGWEELVRLTLRNKDGSRECDVRMVRVSPESVLVEPTIELMTEHFIPRESMNTLLGFTSEPESIASLVDAWREKLSKGNCIAALLADKDEVIAANITYIIGKNEEDFDSTRGGRAFSTIGMVLKQMTDVTDICDMFGVDRYLSAMGLCVHPGYHGLGLGAEVLKAREPLCKMLGLTCTATIFTSSVSQGLATKAGFQTVHARLYRDFIVRDNEHPFEAAEPDKYLKFMARSYTF